MLCFIRSILLILYLLLCCYSFGIVKLVGFFILLFIDEVVSRANDDDSLMIFNNNNKEICFLLYEQMELMIDFSTSISFECSRYTKPNGFLFCALRFKPTAVWAQMWKTDTFRTRQTNLAEFLSVTYRYTSNWCALCSCRTHNAPVSNSIQPKWSFSRFQEPINETDFPSFAFETHNETRCERDTQLFWSSIYAMCM